MSNPARERAMRAVRQALGVSGHRSAPPPATLDEQLVRRAAATDNLPAVLASRAAEVGMIVHATSDVEGLLARLLARLGAGRVAVSVAPGPLADAARKAAAAAGAEEVDWRGQPGVAALYDADVGITDVVAAIAESGSLVVSSDAHHSRGAFLVPPIHIALVPAARIIPDLVDLWPLLATSGERPACTVIVTGPSKTADIEGILITGVHGPGAVHVVVVEG